jgi:hypothetical protein
MATIVSGEMKSGAPIAKLKKAAVQKKICQSFMFVSLCGVTDGSGPAASLNITPRIPRKPLWLFSPIDRIDRNSTNLLGFSHYIRVRSGRMATPDSNLVCFVPFKLHMR